MMKHIFWKYFQRKKDIKLYLFILNLTALVEFKIPQDLDA